MPGTCASTYPAPTENVEEPSFFDPERIPPAIEIASELGLSEAKRHLLVHSRFLDTAAVVVAEFRDQSCPLCHLRPRDWQPIRVRVDQELHEAAQLTGEVADALQAARSCGEVLRRFRDALASAPEPIRDSDQAVAFSNEVAALDNGIQRLREALEAQPPAGLSEQEAEPVSQATMSAPLALIEFRSWLQEHVEELQSRVETLSTSDVLRRFFKLKELAEAAVTVKSTQASIDQEALTLQRLDALIEGVRGLYRTVDGAEEDLNARVLTSLQADVQSTFAALTGQNSMTPEVELTTSHGVRRAKLKIRDFHGLGPVGARDYLSESYRNALGLSLYFSGFGLRSPGAEFFLLDDVTHSADSEHRRGLASYLVGTLAQQLQLVVLTHDDNWFARLRTLAGSGARCIRVDGWRIDGLAVRGDPWVTHLEDADSRIVAGDRTGGNALRLSLESLVSDACEMLSVKVPFKRRTHQVKFDVKRRALVAAMTQAWGSGGFIDPQSAAVLLLQNSQHITNLASHDGTFDAWTQADLLDALGDVRDISHLLTCSNSHGSNRCGGRLRQLSLQNGRPPQCRTCGQPFGV